MKKPTETKWMIVFILLLLSTYSRAQFSFMGGGNISDVRHDDLLPAKHPRLGIFTGFSVQYYPFAGSDKLSVVNELLYTSKGFRQDFRTEKYTHPLRYFAFPVLLSYDFTSRFSAHAGCEFATMIISESLNSTKNKRNEVYREYDIGLSAGAGYYLVPGRLILFSRFNYGLLPQMDYYRIDEVGNMTPVKDVRNMNVMVGLKIVIGNEKIFLFR